MLVIGWKTTIAHMQSTSTRCNWLRLRCSRRPVSHRERETWRRRRATSDSAPHDAIGITGDYCTQPIAACVGALTDVSLVFLAAGAKHRDADGSSAIALAARAGHEDIVRFLANRGADMATADQRGKTPLAHALEAAHWSIATFLVENGAGINTADENLETPLLRAMKAKHSDLTKLLLENGANPNAADRAGETPLLYSVGNQDQSTVNLLLEKGSSSCIANRKGETPLLRAVKVSSFGLTETLLLEEANVDAADEDGETPLLCATKQLLPDIVKLLLRHGASISKKNKKKELPVCLAAQLGDVSILGYMLKCMPAVDSEVIENCMFLAGSAGVVWALLDAAHDALIGDPCVRALIRASEDGCLEVVEALLQAGINPLQESSCPSYHFIDSTTMAAKKGRLSCLLALLTAVSDPDLKASAIRSALLSAGCHNQMDCVLALLQMADSSDKAFAVLTAIECGYEDCLTVLLDNGCDANAADSTGYTALHAAVKGTTENALRTLLERGAELNRKDQDGNTALHVASSRWDEFSVDDLCEAGASKTMKNNKGQTPYDVIPSPYRSQRDKYDRLRRILKP